MNKLSILWNHLEQENIHSLIVSLQDPFKGKQNKTDI